MKRRALLVVAVAVAAVAVIGLAGVYGIGGSSRNGAQAAQKSCDDAVRTAARIAPLAKGELAAFAPTLEARRAPDLAFFDAQGRATTLAGLGDGLRLVNLWATWCAPCRTEMPALDRLQASLGSKDFQVVAINVDTRDAEKPKAFLKDTGITNLAYYSDPKAQSFQDLRAAGRGFGLPTTLLVDAAGCEIGFMAGPAEWSGPDALALLRAALEPTAAN